MPKQLTEPLTIILVNLFIGSILLSGCTNSETAPSSLTAPKTTTPTLQTSSTGDSSKKVFALLGDSQIITARIGDSTILNQFQLVPPSEKSSYSYAGHYMALAKNGSTVFVLLPPQKNKPDQIAVIDPKTAQQRTTYSLLESGVYHSITIGPTTGRLYLCGYLEGKFYLTVLDSTNGTTLLHWVGSPAEEAPLNAILSDDEHYLYVSYHNKGIQKIALGNSQADCCNIAPGYLPGHGDLAFYEGNLLITTGEGNVILQNTNGELLGTYDTGLGGHQMNFVLDKIGRKLYTVKSCGYVGGFSVVDLTKMGIRATPPVPDQWRATPAPAIILAPPRFNVCGERATLASSSILVAARMYTPYNPTTPGTLLILNRENGQVLHEIAVSSSPVDVLVINTP